MIERPVFCDFCPFCGANVSLCCEFTEPDRAYYVTVTHYWDVRCANGHVLTLLVDLRGTGGYLPQAGERREIARAMGTRWNRAIEAIRGREDCPKCGRRPKFAIKHDGVALGCDACGLRVEGAGTFATAALRWRDLCGETRKIRDLDWNEDRLVEEVNRL